MLKGFVLFALLSSTNSLTAAQQPTSALAPTNANSSGLLGGSDDSAGSKCASELSDSGLIYPAVGASYVGGTIPDMPLIMSRGWGTILPFQASQYRVKGKLAMAPCSMVFAFNVKGQGLMKQHAEEAGFDLLPCSDVPLSSRAKGELGCTGAEKWVIRVPYQPINTLTRALKPASEQSANTAAFLTVATAVLTAVLGSFSISHDKLVYGGATVAAGAVLYTFLIRRHAEGENYLGAFVEQPEFIHANVQVIGLPPAAKGASDTPLFKKGNVILFRINNRL
jgi:hypothetical protein